MATQFSATFVRLSLKDQAYLRSYYRPELIQTDDELYAHRQEVAVRRPALPQQAGRAFAALEKIVAAADRARAQPAARASGSGRRISVVGVRQEKPDIERLSKALVAQALIDAQREARSDSASGEPKWLGLSSRDHSGPQVM